MKNNSYSRDKSHEIYYLDKDVLPSIPIPHDCVIKQISLEGKFIVFVFEDDIFMHDSINCSRPKVKSLIMKYHFAYSTDDFSIYKWVIPDKRFPERGCYERLDNCQLAQLTEGKSELTYLYHNVGYCSIITKLFLEEYVILDSDIDYVELEWIY